MCAKSKTTSTDGPKTKPKKRAAAKPPEKAAPKPKGERLKPGPKPTPIDPAKAAYMVEYRRRKAAGEKMAPYGRVTPEMMDLMVMLRDDGLSYRAIAKEVDMDHSYVFRVIKRHFAKMAQDGGVDSRPDDS